MMKTGIEFVQCLLLLAGEVAWGYPWALALGRWFGNGNPTLELPSLAGLLLLSLVSTRLVLVRLKRSRVGDAVLSTLGLLAVCGAALLALPTVWQGRSWEDVLSQILNTDLGGQAALVAIFAGFFWRRGALLGRSRPDVYLVEDEFRTGIVALISLLVVTALAGEHAPVTGEWLVLSTLLFISTGLVGMPLAQIVDISRDSRYSDGAGLTPTAPWLGMLLAVVGGLLATTLLLAQILTFDRVGRAWEMVRDPLGAILRVVIQVAALPFALLVEILVFLAGLLIPPGNQQPRPRGVAPMWPQDVSREALPPISPELLLALKLLAAVALGALFLWLLIRAISRLGRGWQRDGIEESRDSVWIWPGPAALWRWILARLRPLSAIPALAARKQRPVGEGGIREIYREFLFIGALVGRGRRLSETPLEYQRRLETDPDLDGRDEVRRLTDAYLQFRYEPPRPKEPDIRAVASALERLRTLWKSGASRL